MIFLLSNEEALREVTMLQLELILVDTNSSVNKSMHQPYALTYELTSDYGVLLLLKAYLNERLNRPSLSWIVIKLAYLKKRIRIHEIINVSLDSL